MTNSSNLMLSKKIIITCFLAGCLEIYDFVVFGYFSNVLHKNYLSFLDKDLALIASYALFAVGFVFRPLGAIIFGYIGDHYGRKTALVASVSLMGTASFGMFILPTYQSIGIISCIFIIIFRIIQGLSVGGEYSGAIIFAVEHSDNRRAGLVGSIVVSGCMSGVLLATLVSNYLKSPSMPENSWRYAFLLGFVLSLIGFFIRKSLTETPEFNRVKNDIRNLGNVADTTNSAKVSLLSNLLKTKVESLATIFIAATSGANLYFISVYMPNHLKNLAIDTISTNTANLASISTFIMAVLIPVFGYLSDKLGRIKLMLIGAGGLTAYSLILPLLVQNAQSYESARLAIIVHALTAAVFSGPMNTLIVEIFAVDKRYSCSAFNYSIGMGIIGGTTPMVASLIDQYVGNNPMYIGMYISYISFLGLASIYAVSKKMNRSNLNIVNN